MGQAFFIIVITVELVPGLNWKPQFPFRNRMRAAPHSETEVLKRVKGMHVAMASGPLFFIKLKLALVVIVT